MSVKSISIPEKAIINMLKSLPKNKLIDLFWKTLVEIDTSPLSSSEEKEIKKASKEFEKGETIKWKDIK